jgi:hypothetical protein
MLSAAIKAIMVIVVKLNAIMQSVILLRVVVLNSSSNKKVDLIKHFCTRFIPSSL